jgi:hypothetical protein
VKKSVPVTCPSCRGSALMIAGRFSFEAREIDMKPVEMSDDMPVWPFWCPQCWDYFKMRSDGKLVFRSGTASDRIRQIIGQEFDRRIGRKPGR